MRTAAAAKVNRSKQAVLDVVHVSTAAVVYPRDVGVVQDITTSQMSCDVLSPVALDCRHPRLWELDTISSFPSYPEHDRVRVTEEPL
jgi:hypothetical protein